MGLFNKKGKKKLIDIINELPLKKFNPIKEKPVDGNGGKRVAHEIINSF